MVPLETIVIIIHYVQGIIGLIANGLLIYLVFKVTPNSIRTYSILLGNFGIIDFFGCLSGIFVQQRVVPFIEKLIYISSGPCGYISPTACFIGQSLVMHCFSHTFWSLLLSFIYRLSVLTSNRFTRSQLFITICLLYGISLFQFISFCFAEDEVQQVRNVLNSSFPDYITPTSTVSGILNIYKFSAMFCIMLLTVPYFPGYLIIIWIRRKTILLLEEHKMSTHTRMMHKLLLKALTYQACIPFVFAVSISMYFGEWFNFWHNPISQYGVFLIGGILPAFSPLISLYYVRPYRLWIQFHIRKRSIEDFTRYSTPSGQIQFKDETSRSHII